ncbi:MAG TPA: P1 family peptidase [Gaiellaceae bacterium]|nr:P1 family peptidase [Gaiellaceae bacterium]
MTATNDSVELVPRTDFSGPELRFDFPGLRIGIAEYDEGPTGCTVFHLPPGGAACAVDVRGGSPGTIGDYEWTHAICLAGGSLYGLEAASGVAAELMAMRGYSVGWTDVELVCGAIIYDFGRRENAIYPDAQLGRAALRAAREGVFPLGARGAGRSATVGKTFAHEEGEPSGQGGAFRRVGQTSLAVFTVVNAFGAVVDRDGNVVRGHLDPKSGARTPLVAGLEQRLTRAAPGNTTLTVVITNQQLDRREMRQLGVQVHSSMARAIQPFHALVDGDVLYAVTTGEVENLALPSMSLGVLASELAWDAVLAAVS